MKTSFVFVFRRHLQNVLIKTNIFALVVCLQKMSSRRLDQDQYIRLSHTVFKRSCKNVSKTSSRRLQDSRCLQDIFKTSCRDVFKTFSKRLQDVLQKRLKDIFKTSSRPLARISSRRFQDASLS